MSFGAPSPPPVPAPTPAPAPVPVPAPIVVPTPADPSVKAAADAQRALNAAASGRGSTVLTGGQGVLTQAPVLRKVLLGG